MANKEFDFKELGKCKLPVYKKKYCKPAMVKKAKAAIIMLDYKLAEKKVPCVLLTFKKVAEAALAFKELKKNKEHLLKKTGLCKVEIHKRADGQLVFKAEIKKGGINPQALKMKGTDLFDNTLKMKLKVMGGKEESKAEQDTENDETENESSKEEAAAKNAKKAKRSAKIKKMRENVEKMDKASKTAPREKLTANVEKYETLLTKLIEEADSDGEIDSEEQTQIDELTEALDLLKANLAKKNEGGKAKKMTPERKAKIKDNMEKINARLEAITKKLDL